MLERDDAVGDVGRGSCAAKVWRWALNENQLECTSGETRGLYIVSFARRGRDPPLREVPKEFPGMIISPTVAHIFDCNLRSDEMTLTTFLFTYDNSLHVIRYSDLLRGLRKARVLRC
jgi:hypothetical protein